MGNNRWLSYRLFCLLNELPVIESIHKVKGKTACKPGNPDMFATTRHSPPRCPDKPIFLNADTRRRQAKNG